MHWDLGHLLEYQLFSSVAIFSLQVLGYHFLRT